MRVHMLEVKRENGDRDELCLCVGCQKTTDDFLTIVSRRATGARCDRCGAEHFSRAELDKMERERDGCLALRYTRAGTLVGLYRSAEAGMEEDPELPFTTVCEAHGTLVSHRTRKLAEANLGYPDGWCDECRYGPDDPGVQATKREALPER